MNDNKIGKFIRIYMKNGYVFHGTIQSWSKKEGIELKSTKGELVVIPSIAEIAAYVLIIKQDGSFLQEKPSSEPEPQLENNSNEQNDRIKSLVELHKLKAAEELEITRSKMRSPIGTSKLVEYDTISVLQSLKNNIGRQSSSKKRRNNK
jgi:hypothetical protein